MVSIPPGSPPSGQQAPEGLGWWSLGGWQHSEQWPLACREEDPFTELPPLLPRGPQEPMPHELPERRTTQREHLPLPLSPWLHRQVLPR